MHTTGSTPEHLDTNSTAQPGAPLVSIVVPMYNEEKYIAACLDSILRQSYDMSMCEIIVVDGRSTDRSAEIVAAYVRRDPRIRMVENPDRILPAAINVGVIHSRGRYILKMDSHCEYYPDYVARAVETFEKTGAYNIAGLFITLPGAETRVAKAIYLVQASRFGAGASYGRQPGPGRFVGDKEHVTAGWSFRRELFDQIGLIDERLVRNHDNDISYRAYAAGLGVYFDPEIKAAYRSRSTVGSFLRVMYKNGLYLTPLWRIRPGTMSPMHLAPMVWLLSIALGLLGGLIWWPLTLIAAAAFGSHALVGLAVSSQQARQEGWWALLYLPWLYPLTHMAYGAGTLAGLIRFGLGRLPPPRQRSLPAAVAQQAS